MTEQVQNIVDIPLMVCVFEKPETPEAQAGRPFKIYNLRLESKYISEAGLVDITSFATSSFEQFKTDNPEKDVRLLMSVDTDKFKEQLAKEQNG